MSVTPIGDQPWLPFHLYLPSPAQEAFPLWVAPSLILTATTRKRAPNRGVGESRHIEVHLAFTQPFLYSPDPGTYA